MSFSISWVAQPKAQGPSSLLGAVLSTASSLQLIQLPVHRVILLFDIHLLFVGLTNCTYSTRPRSRLYSDIPRPEAPIIYTGTFPAGSEVNIQDYFITLFTFFGLLCSSLLTCLSQRFRRCTLRASSGGWNVELNPLFRLPKKMQWLPQNCNMSTGKNDC